MFKFIVKRILTAFVVLLVAMFAVFAILTYIPGSRLGYLNIWGQVDLLDHLFTALSVKPSLFTRYLRYIYNVFTTFHFASMARHHDLSATVLQRTRFTLLLTFSGFIFIVIFGISAGAYAAYKKGSLFDKAVSLLSMFVASLPPFCLAIYLAMIFCLGLHLLPVFGYDSIKNFILPTITIASASLATTIQTCRFAVIEELNKPYIKNLRSRGQKEGVILFRHALRNAVLPTISVIREKTASIFVSTFIAEWFYAIPGIGYYLIQGINSRDYGVIMASTMVIAIILLLFNIISEVLYCVFDPQLRSTQLRGETDV